MPVSDRALAIAALVVSATSALFSFLQYESSDRMLSLNSQQVRPHVTYMPTFFPEMKALRVDMYLQNQSPIPANVIQTDVAFKVGDEIATPHFFSRSADIIHENKAGVSTLPPLEAPLLAQALSGSSLLRFGTCAIYASTSKTDRRRWQVRAIHDYTIGTAIPARRFIEEVEVENTVSTCSAKNLLSEVKVSNDQTGLSFRLQ
jgi:hypothetical protein